MLRWASNYFSGVSSTFIDGFIICAIAYFTFSQMFFGGDEAAKYIDPKVKFYLNYIFGSLGLIFTNLKGFRSNSYAEYQAEKKRVSSGNTEIFSSK